MRKGVLRISNRDSIYKKIEKAAAKVEALDIAKGLIKGENKTKQVKRALNFATSKKGKLLIDDVIDKAKNKNK